jgi:hypothetical protein
MKQALRRLESGTLYHFQDGRRVEGAPTKLHGDISELRGDVTGLRGDVSGLSGCVDDCALTNTDREARVDVAQLVARVGRLTAHKGKEAKEFRLKHKIK